jgi:(p)ppGpp synthase/HD superfamily hydrolase
MITLSIKDKNFVRQAFKKIKTADYSIEHALNTAKYLKITVGKFTEVNSVILHKILLAAIGHDLLEDTNVTREQIKEIWGLQVLKYIQILTNELGDDNFTHYIENLKKAPEEILLIKFADIYANLANSVRHFNELDKKWIRNFWLPLLANYEKQLFCRKFKKYPQTTNLMIKQIKYKIIILRNLLN